MDSINEKSTPLQSLRSVAADMVQRYKPFLALANTEHFDEWSGSESHNVFQIYIDVTGASSGLDQQIMAVILSPGALTWMRTVCANPYWLWAVIHAATGHARGLPLSLSDVQRAQKQLFEEMKSHPAMIRNGVSGSPDGYSGNYTPWHLYHSYTNGFLYNNNHTRTIGMEPGLLMFRCLKSKPLLKPRTVLKGAVAKPDAEAETALEEPDAVAALRSELVLQRLWQPLYACEMIFNPLFERLSLTPPKVAKAVE